MDRNALLENLYLIQQGLQAITDAKAKQIKLIRSKRKAKLIQAQEFDAGTKKISEKLLKSSFYVVVYTAISQIIFFLFYLIFGQTALWSNLIWLLVIAAVLIWMIQKRMRQHSEKWLDGGIVIAEFVLLLASYAFFQAPVFGVILSVISIVLAFFVGRKFYPQWVEFINSLIRQSNDENYQKYQDTVARNQQLDASYNQQVAIIEQNTQDVLAVGQGWFPKDYYTPHAVAYFISSLENFKADSVKEMVQLYDDYCYKQEMKSQQELQMQMMRDFQDAHLQNQEEMIAQLQYSNVLQEHQIAATWAQVAATDNLANRVAVRRYY